MLARSWLAPAPGEQASLTNARVRRRSFASDARARTQLKKRTHRGGALLRNVVASRLGAAREQTVRFVRSSPAPFSSAVVLVLCLSRRRTSMLRDVPLRAERDANAAGAAVGAEHAAA
jgi:hypothetical protein